MKPRICSNLLKVLRVNVWILSLLQSRCAGIYSLLIICFGYNNVYDSSYASQTSTTISRTLCWFRWNTTLTFNTTSKQWLIDDRSEYVLNALFRSKWTVWAVEWLTVRHNDLHIETFSFQSNIRFAQTYQNLYNTLMLAKDYSVDRIFIVNAIKMNYIFFNFQPKYQLI
jgi:hypothetical protein